MGGVVDAVFGGGDSAPAAPDYVGAAQATAQANLDAARAATAANRVNQVTPYGGLNYAQTGTDQYGNPTWTATQSISPELQPAVNKAIGTIGNYDFSQFNPTGLPSTGINPGEEYTSAIMRRLQPTMQHQSEMSDQQLANQGIMPGSEAYNNAKRLLAQSQNDQLTSAVTGGMGVGLQANQQAYGQQQGTYATNLNAPFNYASNVKAFASPNLVNPAQQQTTAGADILGATNASYQNQLANYNAEQARNSQMLGGLMGLGAAGLMSPAGTFSGLGGVGNWLTRQSNQASPNFVGPIY